MNQIQPTRCCYSALYRGHLSASPCCLALPSEKAAAGAALAEVLLLRCPSTQQLHEEDEKKVFSLQVHPLEDCIVVDEILISGCTITSQVTSLEQRKTDISHFPKESDCKTIQASLKIPTLAFYLNS